MAPTLLVIAAALALRGSARDLFSAPIRWWPAILVAFAIELVLYNPPVDGQAWALTSGPWIWLATRLLLLGALLRNARPAVGRLHWSWLVAAVGVALNTLVIGLNGGHMPQSPEAAVAVWGVSHIDPSRLQNVTPVGPDTMLPWLGDVIAEPTWLPRPNVISVGDVLLAVGIASWAFGATLPAGPSGRRIVGSARAPINGPARPTRRCSM